LEGVGCLRGAGGGMLQGEGGGTFHVRVILLGVRRW